MQLAAITTYRYSHFRGVEQLQLNQVGAPPLRLRSVRILTPESSLGEVLVALKRVMAVVPGPAGSSGRREKSFFAKPVSTYLLVALTLALAWEIGRIVTGSKSFHGQALGALSAYLAYAGAWWAEAPRRRAP